MNLREERITRKQWEQARQRGALVDVSQEADQVGLSCHCEMSVPLYRSLFWKYPSARERDTLAVGDLLHDLQRQIDSSPQPRRAMYHILPPLPTWWMAPRYRLKLWVLSGGERTESVVILSEQEDLERLFAGLPPWIPASLLVRLLQSILRLGTLCYRSERLLVRSLYATVGELLLRSPLQAEINLHLDQWQPAFIPREFSREEYRVVVLRSLLGQLDLTAAVAEQMGAEILLPVSGVLQLMANYVGFVPPCEEVLRPEDKGRFH